MIVFVAMAVVRVAVLSVVGSLYLSVYFLGDGGAVCGGGGGCCGDGDGGCGVWLW